MDTAAIEQMTFSHRGYPSGLSQRHTDPFFRDYVAALEAAVKPHLVNLYDTSGIFEGGPDGVWVNGQTLRTSGGMTWLLEPGRGVAPCRGVAEVSIETRHKADDTRLPS